MTEAPNLCIDRGLGIGKKEMNSKMRKNLTGTISQTINLNTNYSFQLLPMGSLKSKLKKPLKKLIKSQKSK